MDLISQLHHLLILSQDYERYSLLIEPKSLPGLSITATRDPERAIQVGAGCDIVFGEPALVSTALDRLPDVKWVQSTWAGVEPLLLPGMRHDYLLTNIRNVYGPLMSEYVIGYILAIERKLLPRWESQQARKWEPSLNGVLKNKIIGLLGVGTVGSHIARTANNFGMSVYGYTRQTESCPNVDRYFHAEAWREFVGDLDYLVCTLPATPATKNLVNSRFLSAIPGNCWLINVGRGSVIDETALVTALNDHTIGGAILDVFKEEPLPNDHPLWSTPDTLITFHTAAQNNPPDIASIFIENYLHLIRGEALVYQVDFGLGY